MAFCDFLLATDIVGYNCANPLIKGAEKTGLLINWDDVDFDDTTIQMDIAQVHLSLKCGGKKAFTITQNGKQPFSGTQQEMAEGTYQNTLTNTIQFVILNQDSDTAKDIFALANGKFVAIIPNKNGTYQIYGIENGLRSTGLVRELYNDDTLSGWLVTMTEENASMSFFIEAADFTSLQTATSACT